MVGNTEERVADSRITYRDVLVKALGPYRGYWKDGDEDEWAKQRQKDYEQVKASTTVSEEDKAFANELMGAPEAPKRH